VLDALYVLAEHHDRRSEYDRVRQYAARQLELDPWREEAHRQLMRALALSGQRNVALAQYERCRRALANELGAAPSKETTALFEKIKADDLAREDRRHNLPTAPTPLIGRERELAEIDQLLADKVVGPLHGFRSRMGRPFSALVKLTPELPKEASALFEMVPRPGQLADLIASGSKAAHRIAMSQMRGGFTQEIRKLRDKLLTFTSLVELELDFSEEDVEFADRGQLKTLLNEITNVLDSLSNSFVLGNVIKQGIPVAIVGRTNAGKSTLLNLLLREEKAIVSDIEGTTRDSIEDVISIRGVHFRLIDTAGLRHTEDAIEKLGIRRTWEKIDQASVVLQVLDPKSRPDEIIHLRDKIKADQGIAEKQLIIVLNKMDLVPPGKMEPLLAKFRSVLLPGETLIPISAASGNNLQLLEESLMTIPGAYSTRENDVIITNVRHFEALTRALEALTRATNGLNNRLPDDLLSQDIREALHYLGEITGEITNDEVLGNIFKNFCIGK